MFDNVGRQIKSFAKVLFYLGVVGSFIGGLVLLAMGSEAWEGGTFIIAGLLLIVVGTLVSWISSLLLYGFGELIEKIC